jgi:hypothetical protein
MNCRALLAFVVLMAGCGRTAAPRANLLPDAVGEWKRAGLNERAAAPANDVIPKTSVNRVLTGVYSGPGKLDVALFDLTSSATALDAVQRWRPAADTIFFFQDRYFVVVQYQTADRKALNAFVRDLSGHLKPAK